MRRRRTAIFFLVLGICLSAIAIALNVGWVLLNLREVALLVFGVIFFALIITGLILNTIFLVREIRRNEQHDAFLNAVTHELKTPIASIKLYLETLRSRDVDPEKRQEFYGVMLADNERLLATVEQVLQAGRTREKNHSTVLTEIDLRGVLSETIAIVMTRNKLDPATVRYTPPADAVNVLADRSDLQTAFANLLDNAVKYSHDVPKIVVRLKTSAADKAEVFIKDNGVGISKSDVKRIFKRFYRSPNEMSATVKGTGLGLPIVRSIIERYGGRVTAESKGEGRGTTFLVRLPRV